MSEPTADQREVPSPTPRENWAQRITDPRVADHEALVERTAEVSDALVSAEPNGASELSAGGPAAF